MEVFSHQTPSDYQFGFLPKEAPSDVGLKNNPQFQELLKLHEQIPQLVKDGTLRDALQNISKFDIETLESENDLQAAFALVSMLTSAYVNCKDHGKEEQLMVLPKCLAIPLDRLAKIVGRNPMLDYASLVLNNWQLKDASLPKTLDNLKVMWSFTKSRAEEWMYIIHVVIEDHGVEALKAAEIIARTSVKIGNTNQDEIFDLFETISSPLKQLAGALKNMNSVVKKMEQFCKPHQFFDFIRPYHAGWSARGGVIYEDVSDEPFQFGGGSGAQSSLLPSIDACLGICYDEHSQFNSDLLKLYNSMPPAHRGTIIYLKSQKSVRDFIKYFEEFGEKHPSEKLTTWIKELKELYNECLKQLLAFRSFHRSMAIKFITTRAKQIAAQKSQEEAQEIEKNAEMGTNGTMFAEHLKKHRETAQQFMYEIEGDNQGPTE